MQRPSIAAIASESRRKRADAQSAGVRANGMRTFRDRQCWTPLVPQHVETDRAVGVDVGVVDLGSEANLGWLEGVVGGEGDGEEEDATRVW